MTEKQDTRSSTKKSYSSRFLVSSVIICLALIIGVGVGIIYFRSALSTQPVPPTQINCPKEGTARAVVTAPLVLGSHQNVVYIANQQDGSSSLLRYDMSTRKATTILRTTRLHIADARVTANGQWIIFEGFYDRQPKMQMIRMDGQGLQTLFCSSEKGPPGPANQGRGYRICNHCMICRIDVRRQEQQAPTRRHSQVSLTAEPAASPEPGVPVHQRNCHLILRRASDLARHGK